MARISTYKRIDGDDISSNDLMVGSKDLGIDINGPIYETRSYRLLDLQAFFSGGDFTASSPISIAIDASDGHRNWLHDTQSLTKQDPNPGITLYAKDNYGDGTTSNTPQVFSAITSVTTNTTGHFTNYTLTEFTMPEEYSFIVTGDDAVDHSNTGTNVDSVDQTINFEQTLTISGGDAWISTLSSNSYIVSIYHNNVSRNNVSVSPNKQLEDDSTFKAAAPVSNTDSNGVTTTTDAVISDAKGHIIKEQIHTYILPDYKFNIAADSATSNSPAFTTVIDIHSTSGTALDTLSILASAPISSIITANDTITISHDDASTLVTNTAATSEPSFGSSFSVLQSVSRNATGHLTELSPVNVTIPNTVFTGPSGGNVGTIGLVPGPGADDGSKFLKGNGDWATIPNPSVMGSGTPASYAAGLVLAGSATHGNNFLRKDGSWATVTQTSITSSNGTFVSLSALSAATGSVTIAPYLSATGIGANTAAKQLQFLRGDNTWATPPGTFSLELASSTVRGGIKIGYTEAGKNYPLELSSEQAYVNVPWVNTWNANAKTVAGYVSAPGAVANKVWKTDASGNPAWRTDSHDYTFPYTISSSASSGTVVLRNASGYIFGNYINMTGTFSNFASGGTMGMFTGTNGSDNYGRSWTAAQARALLNVEDGAQVNSSNSSTFTVTANNSNNETVYPIFVDGATGSQGAETDTGLFYNPSTGKLTSESLSSKGGSSGTSSKGGVLNLSTKDTAVLENDILGTIEFQAPEEANGGDSRFVAAEIRAVAEQSFTNTQNNSKFEFLMSRGTALTSTTAPKVTIFSSGTVRGNNFEISSDRRLKSEIKPIKEGLEVIKQFTSYNYIKGGEKESGFIAQEVQKVLPHTVSEDEKGMLSMNDRGVVAHMHKAILELEKRLMSIEEKLK